MRESGWSAHRRKDWFTRTFAAMSRATITSHFLLCRRKTARFPAGRELLALVSHRFKWWFRLRLQLGSYRNRPATLSFWKKLTQGAHAGTHGCGVIAILEKPAYVRVFAPGIQVTTTVRVGQECQIIAPMATHANVRRCLPCRDY